MRIVVTGPATISILAKALGVPISSRGLPFPLISQLALEYLKHGHQVHVVTTATDILHTLRFRSGQLSLTILPSRRDWKVKSLDGFKKERRLLSAEFAAAAPDVIHAHWTYEFARAAQNSEIPTLITVHDWAPAIFRRERHPYRLVRWMMQRQVLTAALHINAPSQYIADRVSKTYGKGCDVVPNGLNLDSFTPSKTQLPRVGMLNMGFSRLKNVKAALRAWPLVLKRFPQAELILAGFEFELGGPAHKWTLKNRLEEGVEFRGMIDPQDVPGWLSSLRVFLHTSHEESFGMALVEAIASGLPIVAGASSGAVREVVGAAGTLVDISSPEQIASALTDVLGGLHQVESDRSYLHVSKFNLERVAEQHLKSLAFVSQRRITMR